MIFFLIMGLIFFPKNSSAQIDPPPDPVDTPIDGGLSILIGAGVLYGVKKVKDQRKKSRESGDRSHKSEVKSQ